MAVFAVVDEAGLERRLDARHDRLVDVALALLAAFDLGLEVEQLLAVDDREAPLFRLRRVDQHAFHVHSFARAAFGGRAVHVAAGVAGGDASMHEKRGGTGRNRPGLRGRSIRRSASAALARAWQWRRRSERARRSPSGEGARASAAGRDRAGARELARRQAGERAQRARGVGAGTTSAWSLDAGRKCAGAARRLRPAASVVFAPGNLVCWPWVRSCLLCRSRLSAAASLGDAARRTPRALHHLVAGAPCRWPPRRRRECDGKLRKIKHLQRKRGATHYRGQTGCEGNGRPAAGRAAAAATPAVRQVRIDEGSAGQRLDNFLLQAAQGRAEDARLPRHPLRRGAGQQGPGRAPTPGSRSATRCGCRRCGVADRSAEPAGAGARVPGRLRGRAAARDRQAGRRRGARRQRRQLRRHRAAAPGAARARSSSSWCTGSTRRPRACCCSPRSARR